MTNREKGLEEEVEEEEISTLFMSIMEGYKDSVLPPLSDFSPLNEVTVCEKGSSSKKRGRKEVAENETMQKERATREKMAEKYSVLQSLVPNLISCPKATREKIVTETISYIKSLEEETQRLEDLKKLQFQKQMETKPILSPCMNWKPSVGASVSNGIAFLGIQLVVKEGSLSKIFKILEKHGAEVLVATIFFSDHGVLTLTGKFKVGSDGVEIVERVKKELLSL